MAKLGERRPWRMTFEWTNGIRGTSTHRTREEAERAATKQRARRHPAGITCIATVRHRDDKE